MTGNVRLSCVCLAFVLRLLSWDVFDDGTVNSCFGVVIQSLNDCFRVMRRSSYLVGTQMRYDAREEEEFVFSIRSVVTAESQLYITEM